MMFNFKLGNWRWHMASSIRKYKNEQIYGYTNRTKDGYYIPFLDYDNIPIEWIMPELERLQEDYCLSQFHIIKTSKENKYHAVCFDKMNFKELLKLLSDSTTDFNHFEIGRKLGLKAWTLRLSKKQDYTPRYVTSTRLNQYRRKQSTPHNKLFNKLFKTNIRLKNPDKQTELILSQYKI